MKHVFFNNILLTTFTFAWSPPISDTGSGVLAISHTPATTVFFMPPLAFSSFPFPPLCSTVQDMINL